MNAQTPFAILRDPGQDLQVRCQAAWRIGQSDDVLAVAALLPIVDAAAAPEELRATIIEVLRDRNDERVVPALLRVLAREDRTPLAEVCGLALAHFAPTIGSLLLDTLGAIEPATYLARFTIMALGYSGDHRAIAALSTMFHDERWVTERSTILDALHQLGTLPPLKELLAILRDSRQDRLLRDGIVSSLTFPCTSGATEIFLSVLRDADELVRTSAIAGLGACGDASAVAPLLQQLDDPRAPVRIEIALALGRLGDVRALPALQAARNNDSGSFMGLTVHEACNRAIMLITRVQ